MIFFLYFHSVENKKKTKQQHKQEKNEQIEKNVDFQDRIQN